MGYAWNGVCYESPEKALEGFALDVPKADSVGVVALTGAPSVDGVGLVTWSVQHLSFVDGVATTRTGTTQLQQCSFDSFSSAALPDLVFVVAMVFAFFVGFRSGQAA